MTTTSKLAPMKAGYYVFRGARHIRDAIYEHIEEPVELRPDHRGTLCVYVLGRATHFQLAKFDGTWQELILDQQEAA